MRLGIDAYLTTIFVGLFISQSLDTVVHIMCSSHKFLHNRSLLHTIKYGLGLIERLDLLNIIANIVLILAVLVLH